MADYYPLPAFHFEVKWGNDRVGFTEVSGLTVETEMIEYRVGSDKEFSKKKFPGMKKYNNLTMKRGIIPKDNAFYDWWIALTTDENHRRDIEISLLNEAHEAVMVWTAAEAFPIKVEGPSFKSDGNEVAVESVEIAIEKLTVKAV